MANNKIEFHLFHSVKGGCGKSANALFFALKDGIFAANPPKETDGFPTSKVVLLDADMRGSNLFAAFSDLYDPAQPLYLNGLDRSPTANVAPARRINNGTPRDFHFYTDDVIGVSPLDLDASRDTLICKSVLKSQSDPPSAFKYNWKLDIYFSSPDTETKKAFRANTADSDGDIVYPGYFRLQMKEMLQQLAVKYDKIVIDMSPGVDEYMKTLYEICLHKDFKSNVQKYIKNHSGTEPKVEVHLHLVSTDDKTHVKLTAETIADVYTDRTMFEVYPDFVHALLAETGYTNAMGGRSWHDKGWVQSAGISTSAPFWDKKSISHSYRFVKDVDAAVRIQVGSLPSTVFNKIRYDYRDYIPVYDMKNNDGDTILDTAIVLAREVGTNWLW